MATLECGCRGDFHDAVSTDLAIAATTSTDHVADARADFPAGDAADSSAVRTICRPDFVAGV